MYRPSTQQFKDSPMHQEYEKYTPEDFLVWKLLFERQMRNLPGKATEDYLKGIDIVKFRADAIPKFEEVNAILKNLTGWQLYVVPGLIPDKEFFEAMQGRNFCATTWLRKMEELDYLEEPDMFHDVFGHVPLLTNPDLCDFLADLCRIAYIGIDNPYIVQCVARVYWFTVEFGLIQEPQGLRIYGAGILSSKGETDYSLYNSTPQRLPFDVETIINTPYIKDKYQEKYFVIESYEQLKKCIPDLERAIKRNLEKQTIPA
ncbi:MAG: phenylalanine 4-monooxygenase [Microscillaceae bacterium]|nr:phenylalanine 4-monooxygenase [Microscillaceae bacterium]MDW8461863.1 phenylalanine 4-monooxygenase [Cytophagales bacterium]